MTKLNNYLVTVTEAKEILEVSYGQATPANSNNIIISNNVNGQFGSTVGALSTFCLADSSPVRSNPDNKCPIYQDLIPRPHYNALITADIISATGGLNAPAIGCVSGEFSYHVSVGGLAGSNSAPLKIFLNVTSNVTLLGTGLRWAYLGNTPLDPGIGYSIIAYNGNQVPYGVGYIEIQFNTQVVSGTPLNFAFNAQFNQSFGVFDLTGSASTTDGCYGPISTSTAILWRCDIVPPTTTTTTTIALPTYSFLTNPGSTTTAIACLSAKTVYLWSFTNAWNNNIIYYQGTSSGPTVPLTRYVGQNYWYSVNGYTIKIDNNGVSSDLIEPYAAWSNTGSYNCYGTCDLYNVEQDINPCSPTYGSFQQGSVYQYNSTSCGGCCGQSTSANWQNTGDYACYSTCDLYNIERDINTCSSTYNQTRQGSLYQSNSTSCGGCCGQSTSANWVDNGTTFCTGCNLYQPQINNNACSATYNQTRNVNLGVSSTCGTWNTTFYCVGFDYYSKEVNSCTGAERNVTLVQANSPSCGYVPPPTCRIYNIISGSSSGVTGTYQGCASGSTTSFSFPGGPGIVGQVCARLGTVSVSGGTSNNTGTSCT